jgi:hypothetical protein
MITRLMEFLKNLISFNIIMQRINRKEDMPKHLIPASAGAIVLFACMILATFSESLVGKFFKSFVIFNEHTKTLANKAFSKNEWLTRLLIALLAGIPVALFVAYIKGFFSP